RFPIALGKDGKAYLLNRDNLGGVGGDLASGEVSTNSIITAPAAFPALDGGSFVIFPARGFKCPGAPSSGSIGALELSPRPAPAISVSWCAAFEGDGTPIVTTTDGHSNPIVWIVGAEGDDRLHAFRGDNGESVLAGPQVPLTGVRHFAPIIASREHLFVAADGRIYAFKR
ncbi:MAG: hypothetical protein JO166_16910, partial [Deltaproteobacteria bacterium]|nr:hypothetical protein [Deltaproteobacteria bacterium]